MSSSPAPLLGRLRSVLSSPCTPGFSVTVTDSFAQPNFVNHILAFPGHLNLHKAPLAPGRPMSRMHEHSGVSDVWAWLSFLESLDLIMDCVQHPSSMQLSWGSAVSFRRGRVYLASAGRGYNKGLGVKTLKYYFLALSLAHNVTWSEPLCLSFLISNLI